MGEYNILNVLSLATLFWLLFFLNLLLPKIINKGSYIDVTLWNVFYMILLVVSLVTTLVVIAESIKKMKKQGFEQ